MLPHREGTESSKFSLGHFRTFGLVSVCTLKWGMGLRLGREETVMLQETRLEGLSEADPL